MRRITHLIGLLTAIVVLFGASATAVDAQQVEDIIWRLQITIVTANIGDAGTDDPVSVSLNSSNRTWLDYGRNDFERGSDFTYQLLQNGDLLHVSDITRIQFTKTGSDGWCLQGFELRADTFNGTYYVSMYRDSCRWLDNDNGHSREYTINNVQPHQSGDTVPYESLPTSVVESLIESAVGHQIHDDPLYWDNSDGHVVDVSRRSDYRVHVDLDLKYELNNSTNPSVDVDYDILFGCDNGRLVYRVQNIDIDVGSSFGLSTVIISNHPLIDASANRLRNAIARINALYMGSWCIRVLEGGAIRLR